MPVAPKVPKQWACSRCAWRSLPIRSDVLLPKPECCPKCGAPVMLKDAGVLDLLDGLLKR